MTDLQRFSCHYETRKQGASGVFGSTEYVTHTAANVREAMREAFQFFHGIELETRNPIRCNELTGADLARAMRDDV